MYFVGLVSFKSGVSLADARLARDAARLRVKGSEECPAGSVATPRSLGQAQAEERPMIVLIHVKSLTSDMRQGRGEPKCLR